LVLKNSKLSCDDAVEEEADWFPSACLWALNDPEAKNRHGTTSMQDNAVFIRRTETSGETISIIWSGK